MLKTLAAFLIVSSVASGQWTHEGTVMSAMIAADENNVFEPTLIPPENDCLLLTSSSCLKMWFTGGWEHPNIYYAESSDGRSFHRSSTVTIADHDRPFVVRSGTTLYMFAATIWGGQIDVFRSTDNGRTWPILRAAAIPAGSAKWNVWGVANSGGAVINDTLYLYLEGMNSSGLWSIGLFISTDFQHFTLVGTDPVITTSGGVGGPSAIYPILGGWEMWVHESTAGNLPTDIYRLTATSPSGPWTNKFIGPDIPRLTEDEGVGFSGGQTADAFPVQAWGGTMVYYAASKDGGSASGGLHIKLVSSVLPISKLGNFGGVDSDTLSNSGLRGGGIPGTLSCWKDSVTLGYATVAEITSGTCH